MKKEQKAESTNPFPTSSAEGREALLPDQVLSVKFSRGGYFEGVETIQAIRTNEGILLFAIPYRRTHKLPVHRVMSEKEWGRLLKRLFEELHICDWEREYCDWRILDGEQWNLELLAAGNRSLRITGSNDYPPEWDALLRLFRPFLRECAPSDDSDEAYYEKYMEIYSMLKGFRSGKPLQHL